jgi:hypothetical protein
MIKRILPLTLACALALFACQEKPIEPDNPEKPETEKPETENPDEEKPDDEKPDEEIPLPGTINDPGIAYVWDESVIPEITIHITKDEWNRLLLRYDEYQHNVDYFHADFTYKKGDEVHFIEDGGLRLRGNTSRRRPEGNGGQLHDPNNPDWHHCHFGINFRKYHKDSDHTIHGIRKRIIIQRIHFGQFAVNVCSSGLVDIQQPF